MSFRTTHPLHQRRFSRNLGVGLALVFFIALIFGLTVVKLTRGDSIEAFDHAPRRSLEVQE